MCYTVGEVQQSTCSLKLPGSRASLTGPAVTIHAGMPVFRQSVMPGGHHRLPENKRQSMVAWIMGSPATLKGENLRA